MQLHEKIFRCRRQLGLSQEELAERIGVTRQAVSKWEQGISTPELDSLVALAKIFGVTTDYLLSDAEQMSKTQQPSGETRDWLDRLPGVLQRGFRRYGWLLGVRLAVAGGLFAGLGALGFGMWARTCRNVDVAQTRLPKGHPLQGNLWLAFIGIVRHWFRSATRGEIVSVSCCCVTKQPQTHLLQT